MSVFETPSRRHCNSWAVLVLCTLRFVYSDCDLETPRHSRKATFPMIPQPEIKHPCDVNSSDKRLQCYYMFVHKFILKMPIVIPNHPIGSFIDISLHRTHTWGLRHLVSALASLSGDVWFKWPIIIDWWRNTFVCCSFNLFSPPKLSGGYSR